MNRNTWKKYIELAARLSGEAGEKMRRFIADNPQITPLGLVNYAYGLVTKYGEANSALAAEVYDACATAAGVNVPAAEVVDTPYSDVARAVYATLSSPDNVSGAVSRLVKRAGADTTLRNAARDGAEFAWIPSGDTCAFCIMLASNGWRTISKKSLKNGHAEHIHAHCDCQYAVRFDSRTNVEGYDPDEYLRQYREAGSDVNAMRREQYAQNKDVINAQHREAYAQRTGQSVPLDNDKYRIAPAKIDSFLLKSGAKHSEDFFDVGYSETDRDLLNRDIYTGFNIESKTAETVLTDGTQRFSIFMELGVTQKRRFRTVWQLDPNSDKPRFITAHRENIK